MEKKKHWQYESVKKSKEKYQKEHIAQIALKFNKNTDADILEKLASVENKQGYIKALIRQDIEKPDN